MSESQKHIDLVKMAADYIIESVPLSGKPFVEIDSPSSLQHNYVKSYRPDVYYEYNNQLFIGEAKTLNDFERPHSKAQLAAYLEQCYKYAGDATIVVSIPWQLMSTVKNYFRKYKKEHGEKVRMVVLSDTKMKALI